MSKIYVASSWRNTAQPQVVSMLRYLGHEVYDFKNPSPGNNGFNWREIDANWQNWSVQQYKDALSHPIAEAGFKSDMDALKWADTCVLVMPSGRSAHLEFGYAIGAGKKTVIYQYEAAEPELMYKMADRIVSTFDELYSIFIIPTAAHK